MGGRMGLMWRAVFFAYVAALAVCPLMPFTVRWCLGNRVLEKWAMTDAYGVNNTSALVPLPPPAPPEPRVAAAAPEPDRPGVTELSPLLDNVGGPRAYGSGVV